MATNTTQKQAAKQFVQDWSGKGYEKGETARFWIALLQNVYVRGYAHRMEVVFSWQYCRISFLRPRQRNKDWDKTVSPWGKGVMLLWNWGDGGENYPVIGLPRHGKHLITIVMPSKYITNFRIQKVFNPAVLKEMERDGYYWFSNSDQDRDDLLRYLKSCEEIGLTVIKNEIWNTYAEAAGRFPRKWLL